MSNLNYEVVKAAVDQYGSQRKAAEALEVARSTVQYHLKMGEVSTDPAEKVLHRNCVVIGEDVKDVPYFWYKNEEVSVFIDRREKPRTYEDVRDELIAAMSQHAPVYDKIEYSNDRDHLLVVDPADIHIGKLSKVYETDSEYNIDIAIERVDRGISDVIAKSSAFKIEKIVFVIGNDVIHIDNIRRTTTAGTPQDTTGQWWEMFFEAKGCYVRAIERLTEIAPVHVVFCPSNHDFQSGWMLADTIYSWFRNNPNVEFGEDQRNLSMKHRKYVEYGDNLIGFTHGDTTKEKDLVTLMQHEARASWGRTKYSYLYVHHYHHKIRNTFGKDSQKLEKDHIGFTVINTARQSSPENNTYVEYVRSPSAPDGWHSRQGHVARQAVEAFVHHPDNGQIARFTSFF